MKEDIAIEVNGVSKSFVLPHEKPNSLKSVFLRSLKGNKSYEKQKVLKNISFSVKKGEFFGIVGRNGSGKSTLLKLLAGIYAPDKGQININGKLTPFIELGVGFNPELTGRENVFLNGALLGFSRKEMTALYDEIVEFAELKKFMDQKLKNYSSGMQVRLAFSIAIRTNTDILVLDEVLAVGDAAFQQKCYDYFMKLKKNHQTVILVTHDMGAVRQYCDKSIMIESGKIVAQGNAEDVAQEYQKLFSVDEDTVETNHYTDKQRWGEGGLLCTGVKADVRKNAIAIETFFTAYQDLPAPVYGFTIFGPKGDNILESNTLRIRHKTTDVTEGDQISLLWEVPNIFANGEYRVSVACCDKSTTKYYDWLNDALVFRIQKNEQTAGLVDPKTVIKSFKMKG